jgi:hypothetical protein
VEVSNHRSSVILRSSPTPKTSPRDAFGLVCLAILIRQGVSTAQTTERYRAFWTYLGNGYCDGIDEDNNDYCAGWPLSIVFARFRRLKVFIPWAQVKYLSDRRYLGARYHKLDLGGIAFPTVSEEAYHVIAPYVPCR